MIKNEDRYGYKGLVFKAKEYPILLVRTILILMFKFVLLLSLSFN